VGRLAAVLSATEGDDVPEPLGFVPGIFDLFHVGDLDLLSHARSRCCGLVAAVATDRLVEEVWGRTPFVPEAERIEIVAHMRPVDHVVPLDTLDLADVLPRDVHVFVGGHLLGEDRPPRVERLLDGVVARGVAVTEVDDLRTSASRVLLAALGVCEQGRRSVA
jgi:glycerol-3-phosphate cytidylyltransferase